MGLSSVKTRNGLNGGTFYILIIIYSMSVLQKLCAMHFMSSGDSGLNYNFEKHENVVFMIYKPLIFVRAKTFVVILKGMRRKARMLVRVLHSSIHSLFIDETNICLLNNNLQTPFFMFTWLKLKSLWRRKL